MIVGSVDRQDIESNRFRVSKEIQHVSPRGMEAEATETADASEAPAEGDAAETADMAETEEQPAADAVCLRSDLCGFGDFWGIAWA